MSYVGKTESLDFFGNGIIHNNEGKCCFVKNALPGEEVAFELTEEKKKFAKGYAVEFYTKSLHRQTPSCPYYGECGGCDFQHTSYELEAKAKEEHVLRTLKHIAHVDDFEFRSLEKPKINTITEIM